MSAIVWKEIRENLKWGILLMLAVGACMAWVLFQMRSPYNWRPGMSLLDDGFLVITMIGAGLCGSLLGLLQTVPETWRDQWAFLVHRPITRTRLFFGKVVGGLTLYGLAMLVPLLAGAAWAAMPGHLLGPFDWRYILPGLADVLCGVAFYFAALLTGIRQARWYGSRTLPFALPVICEICINGAPEFWLAVAAIAVCAAVLMTAAWGSFIASGQYCSQPRVAKAALGVVLFVGIVCVGLVGSTVASSVLEEDYGGEWSRYYVDKDGRVLLATVGRYGTDVRKVVDLAGKPVEGYAGKSWSDLNETFLDFEQLRRESMPWSGPGYRSPQRFVRLIDYGEQVAWYYVVWERLVVGYDRQTRMRIGTIGPGGFVSAGAPANQAFPPGRLLKDSYYYSYWDSSPVLACSTGAYFIDVRARRSRCLVKGDAGEPILGAGKLVLDRRERLPGLVGVATSRRVAIFNVASQTAVATAYAYPPEQYPNVQAAALPKGGYAVWYNPSYDNPVEPKLPQHIVLLSAAGAELKRYNLPPVDYPCVPTTWPHALWAMIVPIAGLAGCLIGALIWCRAWYGPAAAAAMIRESRKMFTGQEAEFSYLFAAILVAGAVVWAVAVYLIARRYAFSRRQMLWWTVGGFLLGPAGLLTLLALREWPARIACTSCGRMRLVDRERCEHCGAAFPPPKPTGIEIFDEPEAARAIPAH